ncbi:MAG: hypothetical protein LVO36_04005 [Nitrosopumilus sp. (ex Thoosa mismalolli)]|nr:hypothetical protein [Nitrosopumilus sp. (ex Thoosa mismalolli)]
MIHPIVQDLFDDETNGVELFSWVCEKSDNAGEIEEFIKWHLDANKQVINEILKIKQIDLSDSINAKKWAGEFLENYDKNIRELRETSNKVFERFQYLKKNNFEKLIENYPEKGDKIQNIMNSFLNQNGLLIGKIIFTYRELWFLSNQISNPSFKLGSIEEFQRWEDENFESILSLQKEFENIHLEIKKKGK